MFAEFLTQNEFFEKYIQLFTTRFTISNLEMEDPDTDVLTSSRLMEMYGNMSAFLNIIKSNPEKITPYDLIDIADIVNNGVYQKGFRKTQVDVKKAKNFFPISAREVPQAIYSLFNSYHNIWQDLDVYEREARFHIELVRIQPFEDGNKRTSRIITNYNLCRSNKAPIVIKNSQNEEYFRCIDEYDVEGLTKLFEQNSKEELENMKNLYRNICKDEPVDEDSENIEGNIAISSLLDEIGKENRNSANVDMQSINYLDMFKKLNLTPEQQNKLFFG